MTKLIDKNTTIPTKAQQTFSTADDNQNAVTVHVLQGEREMASGNKSLGRFDLTDIPPAPRGQPQIEVTLDIDANGILNVSAKDKATGKEQSIEIKASSGLSDEEVDAMVKDAEAHADEDKKTRELVDARNQADGLVHATEKSLAEYGDKVDEAEKTKVTALVEALKEAVQGEDKDLIDKKSQELMEASGTLAQAAAGGDAEATSDAGDAAEDDDVVDAEFEEVDDKEGDKKA
ncbi:MAG TPA: molecular chaperone DnaK, partial [Leucothrix sp.]|nr:molecular chaperone DnaK [Leucothrix sp.]